MATSAPGPASVVDSENQFEFAIPDGFSVRRPVAPSKALYSFTGQHGLRASVARFDSANRSAFRKHESEAFLGTIERGLREITPRYKLRHRKSARVDRVPTLDLEFTRRGADGKKERVWMRMLFRYRFTVAATATLPESAPRKMQRKARRFAQGLLPLARR
ncbi:MAG: hypothetical protein GY811_14175 [Myxococcales bacterium]|nr:hypothetical protein [Myxococcales bacterium]